MDPLAQAMADAAQPMGDPNAISINWTLFTGIFAAIDTPTRSAVQAIDGSLAGVVAPILRDAVLLYLTVTIIVALFSNPGGNLLGMIIRQMLRFALIATLLGNAGLFNAHVAQPILVDIPDQLTQGITNSLGGDDPVTGGGPFDDVWNHAFAAGLKVYKNLPSLSIKGLLLALCVFAFWFVTIATVAIAFLIFLAAHVIKSLLVAVAPAALGCAAIAPTRQWFAGWLNAVVGVIVTQVLVTGLMSLMILVQITELSRIAAQPPGANEVGQVAALLGVGAIVFICAIIAKQIPSISMAIGGGAYIHMQSFVSAAGGALSSAASGIAAGIRAGTFGKHGIWGATAPGVSGFQRQNFNMSFAGRAVPGSHYSPAILFLLVVAMGSLA